LPTDTAADKRFYEALRIRLVEERIASIYPSDSIQSPIHLSNGQEAIAVGVCAALTPNDLVFGSYRSHALYLAKGGGLDALFAELYGKATGCGGGKAGSMHLCAPEVGMMGASAIVASTIPHAVGAALATRILGQDHIVAAFYGEGATGEGVYHESLNIAATKRAPLLLVCENNDLAIYTRVRDTHAFEVLPHARSYGIPGVQVQQGWDIERVAQAAAAAVDHVRTHRSPYVLEVQTCRYLQHVGPDDDLDLGYRDAAAVDAWKERDPLIQDRARIERYQAQIEAQIDRAVAHAEASPFPSPTAVLQDVL
jgi:pyruvate dehydrogenase E1 component alpha subunit